MDHDTSRAPRGPRVVLRARVGRRTAALVLAAVGVLGLGVASAAQLTVTGGSLGAGQGVVASCQPAGQPISVGFTTQFTGGQFVSTAVRLSNVNAACVGRSVRIQLVGAGNAAVGAEVVGTVTGASQTITLPAAVPSANVLSAAVVIHS